MIKVLFWISWTIGIVAFAAWRYPQYAGMAGLICIAAIFSCIAALGMSRWPL